MLQFIFCLANSVVVNIDLLWQCYLQYIHLKHITLREQFPVLLK